MTTILIAVGLVAGLGLIAGLVLSIASAALAVPHDERVDALRAALPGANCGACGFSGCDGYAEAMAAGKASVGLCTPGGATAASATAAILGVADTGVQAVAAQVRCGGCEAFVSRRMEYRGVSSCTAAKQFFGGDSACTYGCLGYGDCQEVCTYNAITVEKGLAQIDPAACQGCGQCAKACPQALIAMVPAPLTALVRCANHDKGAAVRKVCTAGCIGCQKCVKVCEYGAVRVENFLAYIDPQKCQGCGACAQACPSGCITVFVRDAVRESAAVQV